MATIKTGRFKLLQCSLILTLLLPMLAGCWSAHEVSDIAIVNAMGIDQAANGQLEVTTVIVKPADLFPEIGESGHPNRNAYIVQTVSGKNMLEVMEKLSNIIPEEIYFGHLETVVFGREAAINEIKDSLDFLNRGNDFRPNTKLLVANGLAKDIVNKTPELNSTIGLEIQDLVSSKRFGMSKMVEDISQFTEKMDDRTEDPYTGFISSGLNETVPTSKNLRQGKVIKTEKNSGQPPVKGQQGPSNALQLQGTAVFKGARLKGILNTPETRGLLLIKGQLDNGVVTLDCENGDQGTVGLQITNSQTTLTPKISHGRTSMQVSISVDADIGQYTCRQGSMSTEKINQLNEQFEGIMKSQVDDVLNVAQKNWQTDIFGFGKAIYHSNPVEWRQMAPNWRNGLLKEMDVNVKIKTNINRFGLRKETGHVNETR